MFLIPFFCILARSAPDEPGSGIPEQPTDPVEVPTPAPTPMATLIREEEATVVVVLPPENITSNALFIAFCVLLGITFIAIIASVIYFCVSSRNSSRIGAADFTPDQIDNNATTIGTTTRGTQRVTIVTPQNQTTRKTMKTSTYRPGTPTETHAKSIYAVNTVIL